MKKLIFVLSMLPIMAMADEFDIPGTPVSDEELGEVIASRPPRCISDFYCAGKAPGNVCVIDPARGQTGICRAISHPDNQGNVSCRCL